ncbi:MAG: HlyD family efflux transporter periplasmic adaptor subunit [Oscillospiraceae bacterium]|nr:HlyD family efflux transporter periplasmic adaptor subunit [Oscillospiraceae bacterium]
MSAPKSKKKLIVSLAVLLLAAAAGGCWWYFGGGTGEGAVYVTPVSVDDGWHYGSLNRYNGVVEPQAIVEINPDNSKTVDEVYVQEGDVVSVGDKLFCYDTAALQLEVLQLQVDVQRIESEITTNKENIALLQAEKAAAPAEMQLEYTLQIQQLQNSNQSLQYSLKAKRNELTQLQAMLKDTNVTSPVNGTVKSVNSGNDPYSYSDSAFITIMESGEFLVKGTVNELNMWQLYEGMPVTVRSRIDETTWSGTLQRIDTSAPVEDNNYYYYGGGDEALQSSKYNFYVQLDSNEGLFVGQHVTIEMDAGEQSSTLSISDMFICDIDTAPYVWKDKNGRLVKQSVELGAFNEMSFEYEILSGLTAEDYIAFPSEELREGMRTTTEYADVEAGVDM